MLIDDLRAIQETEGYLPREKLEQYSRETSTPLYRLHEVATFYPWFRTEPPAETEILVCTDLSCHLSGAPQVLSALAAEAESSEGQVAVHACSCLGRCESGPAVTINDRPVTAPAEGATVAHLVAAPSLASGHGRLEIDPYDGGSDYAILGRLQNGALSADEVVAALKESGLRGMGGAGFPAGVKWDLVRKEAATPKYVICNADESEPGTFKDRDILARAPHLVWEGMLIAASIVGASEAIVYIRHEYQDGKKALEDELRRATAAGRLPTGPSAPTLRIFESPGGYICGEETALLEALEDKRAEPRNKPPFPGTFGLHGMPTLINNVETFALATAILSRGVDWYQSIGENGGVGPKYLALSGDVHRPGVYSVPLGITIRQFLDEYGGGTTRPLKAIAPGGASSGFLPASLVDTPLEFGALQQVGSMLGSGAVVAIGEGRCMLDLALNVCGFFKNESCGKCVPCRVGSEKLVYLLEGWRRGAGRRKDLPLIEELAAGMADASICGLGQVAPAPFVSALKHFEEEILAHADGRCPEGVCPMAT